MQPTPSDIKEGDEVRYRSSASTEGTGSEASEENAVVVKVHPDVDGAHYTIRTMGKDQKEKNTDASRITKVEPSPEDGMEQALIRNSGHRFMSICDSRS